MELSVFCGIILASLRHLRSDVLGITALILLPNALSLFLAVVILRLDMRLSVVMANAAFPVLLNVINENAAAFFRHFRRDSRFCLFQSGFFSNCYSLQTFFWEKALTEYLRGFLLKDSWSSVKCLLFCQFLIRDKLYFSVIFAFQVINTEFFHASWVFFVIY